MSLSGFESLHQAQQQFWNALKDKDREAMQEILSADFIARSPNQPNQGRADFINSLTSFSAQVQSIGSDNLEIHIWGEIGVVTGVQSAEVKLPDGQIRTNKIAITNIYQNLQGRWMMKLAHAVSME